MYLTGVMLLRSGPASATRLGHWSGTLSARLNTTYFTEQFFAVWPALGRATRERVRNLLSARWIEPPWLRQCGQDDMTCVMDVEDDHDMRDGC